MTHLYQFPFIMMSDFSCLLPLHQAFTPLRLPLLFVDLPLNYQAASTFLWVETYMCAHNLF